jgi:hypothetical protein
VNESLQLAVERTRFAEERATFVDELTATRGHRAEIRQLERQLALAQAQVESHAEAVKDLEDRLAKSAEEKKAGRARLAGLALEGDGFWNQSGYEQKLLLKHLKMINMLLVPEVVLSLITGVATSGLQFEYSLLSICPLLSWRPALFLLPRYRLVNHAFSSMERVLCPTLASSCLFDHLRFSIDRLQKAHDAVVLCAPAGRSPGSARATTRP